MDKKNVLAITIILIAIAGLASAVPGNGKGDPQNDRGPLEKITFIHYKKVNGKPGTVCGNDVCEQSENANNCPVDCGEGGNGGSETSSCFAFISKGVAWTVTEPLSVNPTNTEGLSEASVLLAVNNSVNTWEAPVSFDIFGTINTDYTASYNNGSLDGVNTITFGDAGSNVLAFANIWGIFRGPPSGREIVEWDIVINQVDFDWGNGDINSLVFDLENIVVHEMGHSTGLSDLYDTLCVDQTMYGFSGPGETNKRTLEDGDIAGLIELYG